MAGLSARPTVPELKAAFAAGRPPTKPVTIAPGSVVVDARRFVRGHFAALESNAPQKIKKLYYFRLLSFFNALHPQQ